MPEGPELRMNSMFINNVCKGLLFCGRPIKSSVSKNPEIDWESQKYTISSQSRGKELSLHLHCRDNPKMARRILFRFGMSGKFIFTTAATIPKHAHLQFYACHHHKKGNGEEQEKDPQVLSFVDVRRFGSWHVMEGWGEERGPDIIDEYDLFRANVLESLEDVTFNRAICETMLNQKYFNGIGNYLRAEILYRAKIPPFTCARTVLEPLATTSSPLPQTPANPSPDILCLCRDICQEVVQLKIGLGKAEKMTTSVSTEDHAAFLNWLQCYNNANMSIMKDKHGRSVWFQGVPGPMAPKGGAVKAAKRRQRAPDNPNPSTNLPNTKIKQEKECDDGTTVELNKKASGKARKRRGAVTSNPTIEKRRKPSGNDKGSSEAGSMKCSVNLVPIMPRRSARLKHKGTNN